MAKNYYIVLGIPPTSSQRDIKAAYRRLAKEYHPDYYGKDQGPFQLLQEAYSVLSDPQGRQLYDDSLKESAGKQRAPHGEPVRPDLSGDIIEPLVPDWPSSFTSRRSERRTGRRSRSAGGSLFDRMFEGFAGYHGRERDRGDEVRVEITLSPEQALRGGSIRLRLPFTVQCPSCYPAGNSRSYHCRRCHGAGILAAEKPVVISYPAGITQNHSLQMVLQPDAAAEAIRLTAFFRVQ